VLGDLAARATSTFAQRDLSRYVAGLSRSRRWSPCRQRGSTDQGRPTDHKWLFTGITAADLINDRVVPFYDAREVRPSRVLTNRGRSVAAIQNTGNTNSIWRSRISTIGAPSSRAQKRMKFHKRSVPMASSCSLIRQLKADCALRICSTGSGRDDEQPKTQ
jgi:hypothetical protein